MTAALAQAAEPEQMQRSLEYCRELTRAQARNFYYALRLLPEPKRSAMYVLYAYMRVADDIADAEDGRSVEQRIEDLDSFLQRTREALAGRIPLTDSGDHSARLWRAFAEMAGRYAIPAELFDDMIAGQRQDLQPVRFETFEQLAAYCYRVAGVVGLASIHIWGHEGGESTRQLAIDRGLAFQLTNILRDLREDAQKGRVYLPREEMAEAGVSEDGFVNGVCSTGFDEFMRRQIERAEAYYRTSAELESRIERDSRPALVAMTGIYHGILKKIAKNPGRVLKGRVRLSLFSKLMIGWRAMRNK